MARVRTVGGHIRYEVTGSGPPLVLLHGATGRGADFHDLGYVEALAADFTVVTPDLRGHGANLKPRDPAAYASVRFADDVATVLDGLSIETAHLFGHSLGGRVASAAAAYHPGRLRSVSMSGASPVVAPAETWAAMRDLLAQGVEAFAALFTASAPLPPSLADRLTDNDAAALTAMFEHFATTPTGLDDALVPFGDRCLLVVGELDPVLDRARQAGERLGAGAVVVLDGLDHLASLVRADLVVPHLRSFLQAH